jgi:hypothetical protein
MTRVEISQITGTTPIDVYVADYYGNFRTYLGTISTSVPPSVFYDLPSSFNDVPLVKLILIDSNGCESNHNTECTI